MTSAATSARRPRTRAGEEVWETTTDGLVWLNLTTAQGRERLSHFGGKAGERVRISTLDREVNQDAVASTGQDPFTNGMLKRVDADQQADELTASGQVFSTEELLAGFALNGAPFKAFVDKLNEFNVRRMLEMVTVADASASQGTYLRTLVEGKYRIHGSTETYEEMKNSGDAAR